MATISANARKLVLLKYPRVHHLSYTDPVEVAALIAFIEDRHVRAWEISRRDPLRKPGGEAWTAAFAEYLQVRPRLGSPPSRVTTCQRPAQR